MDDLCVGDKLFVIVTDIPVNYGALEQQIREDGTITLPLIKDVKAAGKKADPCGDIEFYLIEIDFDALTEKGERSYFKNLPTSFHLSFEAVDLLRAAGRRILIHSTEFQRLLRDLAAPARGARRPQARHRG
jgi:hypothetical protein